MKCPNCGAVENHIVWTRGKDDRITRARDCENCGKRFQTAEALVEVFDRARELEEAFRAMRDELTRARGRQRTALYRYFDARGALLYVGITKCHELRRQQHRRTATWFPNADRVEVQNFASRREALDAERAAIRGENPLFNRVGKPK